jgi:hypothetical protein
VEEAELSLPPLMCFRFEGLAPTLAEPRDNENPDRKVCDPSQKVVRQNPWRAPRIEQLAYFQSHNVEAEQTYG